MAEPCRTQLGNLLSLFYPRKLPLVTLRGGYHFHWSFSCGGGTSLQVNCMIAGQSSRWMKKEAFEVELEKITGSDHTEGWLDSAFEFIVDAALSTSQVLHTIKK